MSTSLPERCDCERLKIIWDSPTCFTWVDTMLKITGPTNNFHNHDEALRWAKNFIESCCINRCATCDEKCDMKLCTNCWEVERRLATYLKSKKGKLFVFDTIREAIENL